MPKFGEEGMDPVEMAERSVAAREAQEEILEGDADPLKTLQKLLGRHRPAFANALRKAALGQAPYKDLPVEKQMEMLKVAMYYTFGRPQMAKSTPEPDEPEERPAPPSLV